MYKIATVCLVLIASANFVEVTYYEILGVTKQASFQEIRQAYKKLAIKFHPDKNPDTLEQDRFLKITEAYETLKDSDRRRKYDLYGSFSTYTRNYEYQSSSEYNSILNNGLYHEDPFVENLSRESYNSFLSDDFHFVNFYSPFCPPCQKLEDHWKKLAEVFKGIVKVGAVNCKRHNSFCYNTMRIGSYPTLLFYPNGKHGNYLYYRGEKTFEALEKFVTAYINKNVYIPTVSLIRDTDKPMVYLLGGNRIEKNVMSRIAYHLVGLASVVIVEDENLRAKLTDDDYTTIVFKHRDRKIEIRSLEEKEILAEIGAALPSVESIDIEKLKKIRNGLRSGSKTPWVLFFSGKNNDNLHLLQMKADLDGMNIGQIDCDTLSNLCLSLQVETTPAWAVLKQGGVYQKLLQDSINVDVLRKAAEAKKLHSLSIQEFTRILDGDDKSLWALLVLPYGSKSERVLGAFTHASINYRGDKLQFGIVSCAANSDHFCRMVAPSGPTIVVSEGSKMFYYSGGADGNEILTFIDLVEEDAELMLSEAQVLEVLDPGRESSWLVAFLPAGCGQTCQQLLLEWKLIAKKVKPLDLVRVGVLQCERAANGFCVNVRAPTGKLYLAGSTNHYTADLRKLSKPHQVLEWMFSYLDNYVTDFNWQAFSLQVLSDELRPSPNKKPWLVYFHSPRCHHCHELNPDFAMAGKVLKNAVHLGKVNCLNEQYICQHEQIMRYPSLRLYLPRSQHHPISNVVSILVRDHKQMVQDIKPHLYRYNEDLLVKIESLNVKSQGFGFHDEF